MKLTEKALLRAIGNADEKLVEQTAPPSEFSGIPEDAAFVPEQTAPARRIHRIVGGSLTVAAAAACIAAVTVLLPKLGKDQPPVLESTTAATTTQTNAVTHSASATTETTETTETTAEPDPYPEFHFQIENGKAYLIETYAPENSFVNVTIPESYKGVPVVEIGPSAFGDCENLKSITIPDSVTSIGKYAFVRCTALENVRLPENLTQIGEKAFEDTAWLNQKKTKNPLVIVNGILLDGSACKGKVVIPDGTVMIADGAFLGDDYDDDKYGDVFVNTLLTSVICPPSLKVIGANAFKDCVHLKSVTLSEGLERIERSAFLECYELESVSIPASAEEISDGAFSYCGCDPRDDSENSRFTIRGKAGSFAETYAAEHDFQFIAE